MKKNILFISSLLILIIMNGCIKDKDLYEGSKNTWSTFNWRITNEINFEIDAENTSRSIEDQLKTILIFTDKTLSQNSLIATGAIHPDYGYKSTISIPTAIEIVYIVIKNPDEENKLFECKIDKESFIRLNTNENSEYNLITDSDIKSGKSYSFLSSIDNDNDGVPASEDFDDNDPDIAYISYFPNAKDQATILFEDLWPNVGDNDMNDIVANINIEYFSNSSNMITSMKLKWKLRAAGATRSIGMGLQLNEIYPSEISSAVNSLPLKEDVPFTVDTKGLEPEQTKAVIPIFNCFSHVFGQFRMTNTEESYTKTQIETITIKFNSPISPDKLTENKLNFFIVVSDSKNITRNIEVHMPNHTQTDKGIIHSTNSNLSRNNNYLSAGGMMWGMMIPLSIPYVFEGANIEKAYLHFNEWYQSNGESHKDWYYNKPEYRHDVWFYDEPDSDE